MFKKIILLVIVLMPFWYSLFVGYPVGSNKELKMHLNQISPGASLSNRCFGVGSFDQFVSCFDNHNRLSGTDFINAVFYKTNQISPIFSIILGVSFILFIVLSICIIVK